MPNYTKTLNLIKPNESENYDIETVNTNMDMIDAAIDNKQEKVMGKSLSSNDFTNEYKKKIDLLQQIYNYKGAVNNYSELLLIQGQKNGDIYTVVNESNDYVWNDEEWVLLGNTINTAEIYNEIIESGVVVSGSQPIGSDEKKVWFKKGKNSFDKNNKFVIPNHGFFENNSTSIQQGTMASTIYISCEPNTTYTVQKVSGKRFGLCTTATIPDVNTTIIDKIGGGENTSTELTITTSANAKYLCVLYYASNADTLTEQEILDTIQIEIGSTATAYENYIEPTILVKNSSGDYEEFINKNNLVNYSTGEKRIGTWIDGKPLYRKVVSSTMPQTTTGTSTGKNIDLVSNTDFCMIEFAYFIIYGNQIRPIPFLESATQITRCWYLKDPKQLRVLSSFQDASNCPIYISILYTKTTD